MSECFGSEALGRFPGLLYSTFTISKDRLFFIVKCIKYTVSIIFERCSIPTRMCVVMPLCNNPGHNKILHPWRIQNVLSINSDVRLLLEYESQEHCYDTHAFGERLQAARSTGAGFHYYTKLGLYSDES